MLVLVGTIPVETCLYLGKAVMNGRRLGIGETFVPVERGTAAMAAACAQACAFYGIPAPYCIFGGDISDGRGTELLFREINANLEKYDPEIITLHYLFPKISYGEQFIQKVSSFLRKPQIIADAGGMYLLKTINCAGYCDVFTPDEGELLFLADEFAAHPLYVRTDLLKKAQDTAALVRDAYKHGNAAETLVIKGAVDRVYREGKLVKECREPPIPAMEAIGGTGDTITGMLSAFRYRQDPDAEYKALAINRLIGQKLHCTPATQIIDFIDAIPGKLKEYEKNLH